MNTSTLIPPTNATVKPFDKNSSRAQLIQAKLDLMNQGTVEALKAAWDKRVQERGLEQALKDNAGQ